MAVTDDDDQGGGGLSYDDDSEEVTGGEGGYLEKVTEGDMGGGGFSGPPKKGDVINEQPLTCRVINTCWTITVICTISTPSQRRTARTFPISICFWITLARFSRGSREVCTTSTIRSPGCVYYNLLRGHVIK